MRTFQVELSTLCKKILPVFAFVERAQSKRLNIEALLL